MGALKSWLSLSSSQRRTIAEYELIESAQGGIGQVVKCFFTYLKTQSSLMSPGRVIPQQTSFLVTEMNPAGGQLFRNKNPAPVSSVAHFSSGGEIRTCFFAKTFKQQCSHCYLGKRNISTADKGRTAAAAALRQTTLDIRISASHLQARELITILPKEKRVCDKT